MSEFRIVPRTEIGLPAEVKSSDGALRPPLYMEKWLTNHYTGNNVDYTNADVASVIRQIQAVFSSTKPFEYNYVIGQWDDNNIYEFAGKFQAAHSGGENSESFGVLFLNGTMDPLTGKQIRKYQWLRDVLIYVGALRPDVIELPHKQMPGAATACSGPYISTPTIQNLLRQKYIEPSAPPPISNSILNIKGINEMNPIRIFDSRNWPNPFTIGEHVMPLTAFAAIPAEAQSLVVTVTAVPISADGYVTLWGDGPRPDTSNLNYTTLLPAICNTTLVPLANRAFKIYTSADTHLLFDVIGYS